MSYKLEVQLILHRLVAEAKWENDTYTLPNGSYWSKQDLLVFLDKMFKGEK